LTFRRTFPAGVAGTWAAMTPHKMIRESGTAHAGQGDTRLGPGAHWCLRCYRSEVLIEVAALDVLAALTCPLQRDSSVIATLEVLSVLPHPLQIYPGILPRMPTVELCPEVVGLCALTEGERTNTDASCWRRDDHGLDLIEVECAILSSRSRSSRHCFMAPGEAVELGGCRSNSLTADNAPRATLDGAWDVCAAICCCAACIAAVPDTGQLGTCGVEEATSSSTTKSTEVSVRCSTICTIMLSKKTSKNLMPSPLPGTPNVREEIL
jgi:hypothetical protein